MLQRTRLNLDSELKKILNWGRNSEDIASMLRECAKIYREWAEKRFIQNSHGGGDWEPLKPDTVKTKTRKGRRRPKDILVDTGQLRDAVGRETILGFKDFPHYGMGASKTISRIKPSISIGIGVMKYPNGKTTDEIAEIHQYGTQHIPVRPIFVQPPPEVRAKMAEAVLNRMMALWGELK